MFPIISAADNIICKDTQQGIFKFHGLYGSLNTIVRTNEKQTETLGKTGTVFEYDIQWTSDCTYLLFNRNTIKSNDSIPAVMYSDTIYNEVVEANDYWHKVVSSVNGNDPKIETSYFIIDTTSAYRDLDELDKFKDYKGKSSGGTLVGYNYAVTYKQHSTEMSNYIIAFLEALVINKKSKFKVLDDVYFSLDTNQKIVTSNCRFNDKYDKEIIAIYSSTNRDEDALIIKAWRFNKLKLKIEEVPVENVKYKESDKKKLIWSD